MSTHPFGLSRGNRWLRAASLLSMLLLGATAAAQTSGTTSPAPAPVVAPAPSAPPASSPPAAPAPELWWETAEPPSDTPEWVTAPVRDVVLPTVGATERAYTYDALLDTDLYVQTDLVLPGISSVQTVTFPRPRTWRLLQGSELRLLLEHSSALIPERSHLTVYINDVNVRTIQLDQTNVTTTEIRLPLPLHILQDYNVLKLEVQQHYTNECEDPFDPALWTKVSRRSVLHFVYQHKPVTPDLLAYPMPIFDRQSYGPTVLRYVLPSNPSAGTLEALGQVTVGLGREVSYGRLAFANPLTTTDGAPGHALLVGTAQENPEVARYVGDKLAGLGAGQGLVAMLPNPTNPFAVVLVVTGSDPAGVLLAAKAISSPQRNKVLSGNVSIITKLVEDKPAEPRDRPGFVPPETRFTLKDLGFRETTVRGFFSQPVKIEVRALPDLQFLERLQHLTLQYSYGAQLDTRFSTMEVRWNNIALQSVALDNPEGEQRASLDVNVPVEVMAPYNTLEIVFHLLPKSYNPCETKVDHQLWATVFDDSDFNMPRYHWAEMPDLGKLQYGVYPYGIYQDLADTVVVLADNPDETDLMAGLTLAGELGRATIANRAALRMMRSGDVTDDLRAGNHLIVVSSGTPHSTLTALKERQALFVAAGDKTLSDSDIAVLQAIDPNQHGVLEQLVSPWGKEKVLTVVQGLSPDLLKRAIRMMTDIRLTSRLTGNIALMGLGDELRTLQIGKRTTFGSIPFNVFIEKWGRQNIWMVIGLLLAGLLLMFYVLKAALRVYRARHHGAGGDGGGGGGAGGPGNRPGPGAPQQTPDLAPAMARSTTPAGVATAGSPAHGSMRAEVPVAPPLPVRDAAPAAPSDLNDEEVLEPDDASAGQEAPGSTTRRVPPPRRLPPRMSTHGRQPGAGGASWAGRSRNGRSGGEGG